MMKYLLAATAAVSLALSTVAEAKSLNLYEDIDFNEDVVRKVSLDQHSVIQVLTEIKFRSASPQSLYYYVIPRDLDFHHISI